MFGDGVVESDSNATSTIIGADPIGHRAWVSRRLLPPIRASPRGRRSGRLDHGRAGRTAPPPRTRCSGASPLRARRPSSDVRILARTWWRSSHCPRAEDPLADARPRTRASPRRRTLDVHVSRRLQLQSGRGDVVLHRLRLSSARWSSVGGLQVKLGSTSIKDCHLAVLAAAGTTLQPGGTHSGSASCSSKTSGLPLQEPRLRRQPTRSGLSQGVGAGIPRDDPHGRCLPLLTGPPWVADHVVDVRSCSCSAAACRESCLMALE